MVALHNSLKINVLCVRNACITDKINTIIEAPYIMGFHAKKTAQLLETQRVKTVNMYSSPRLMCCVVIPLCA